MKLKSIVVNIVLAGALFYNLPAFSVPVKWATNNHYYEYIYTATEWANARSIAQGLTYNGTCGYLATITSEAEDIWIRSNFGVGDYYIGGYQPAGSHEPNGGYCWVTGEAFSFDRVSADNYAGQDVLYYYHDGYWDDDSMYGGTPRYFLVEYGTYIDDNIHGNAPVYYTSNVPEPATLSLICLSVLGLWRRLKK